MNDQNLMRGRAEAGAPWVLPWLLLLFVGSGCAALIYEIVWLQLLQLMIGLTTVSLGILLGTFMGGMCLGSLLLPRLIPRHYHPLRVYAFLELGIAVIGIALLFVIPWVSQTYLAHAGAGFSGILMRGLIAALCLLPPTILMGATLPAVARWIETTRQGVSWLGFFYGGNIAGAVLGCLLAGFYLLRVYDMETATYLAAGINVAAAVIAFGLAAIARHRFPQESPATGSTAPIPRAWIVYVVAAFSGAAALGAEVTWTRLLSLVLGGTTYTFSMILAAFLVGLGLGSTAGALAGRNVRNPRLALGFCQLLLTAGVAWTAFMICRSIPYWPINPSISISPWYTFQLDLARCFWAVLPPAFLWGASFPLALTAVAASGEDPGHVVGRIYAANTVGAILGALGFSLWIIPQLGTQSAQRALIAISAAAALLAFASALRLRKATNAEEATPMADGADARGAAYAGITAVAGLAFWLIWTMPVLPWGVAAYGRYMATYAPRLGPTIIPESQVPSAGGTADIFCNYLGEGLNGTVAVTKKRNGERSFHSAGKVQASTEPRDMRLQRMLGHLSALGHQKPESVLVVACGAGVTAGTFVLHPSVQRIVICDIEPLVPNSVAPLFERENYGVIKDPRTQVVLDDGRHFIRTTHEKFDIITSDPIDPWVKGCAALNTVEYYEACKARLKPGGVMSLWIPLYESNSDTVKSIIASFFNAFPNGTVWSNDSEGEGYDAVLFGQAEPTLFDLDQLQARLRQDDHARVRESLREVGFSSALSLLATYAGQASDLRDWMRDAQLNTDHNLRLQYLAGMWFNSFQGSEILEEIHQFYRFPDNLVSGSESNRKILRAFIEGVPVSQ